MTTEKKEEAIIKNYGLFWRVDRVNWGYKGTLEGRARGDTGKKEGSVNFRKQKGIYALYSNYKLMYIGQARGGKQGTLFGRLKHHLKVGGLSGRWDRFSWFGMLQPLAEASQKALKSQGDTRDLYLPKKELNVAPPVALDMLEAVSIAISEPRLNLQRGKWKKIGATQYYQWGDEDEWYEDEDETE